MKHDDVNGWCARIVGSVTNARNHILDAMEKFFRSIALWSAMTRSEPDGVDALRGGQSNCPAIHAAELDPAVRKPGSGEIKMVGGPLTV
jgi:hypothetical protein